MPEQEEQCIFCRLVRGEIPSHRVYEDDHTMAFLDIRPIAAGHTLVIPKKHYSDFLAIPPSEVLQVMETAQRVARGILRATGTEGFNLGVNNGVIAGQVVFHFHVHIIPRSSGDNLRSWGSREHSLDESLAEKIGQAMKDRRLVMGISS